ncbi:MAG: EAL domain-containing protein [Pseudomonadales bacterium]|nr:EAL domain-containing protein [Pseudomonadales bacterium]
MSRSEPVRLLILETSQNRAEELIVLLRTAGRATRAHYLESEADLNEKLKEQTWDLFVGRFEANGLSAELVIEQIRAQEKDIPVILIADDQDPASITAGMRLGALDVALDDDDERLTLIIERELGNLLNRRQRRRAEVELRETERRNQLLLDSSNAAIAYVHEGMHIYTNQTYAGLFGYEDPDDFTGIPIIDLISREDQNKFKGFLKSYDENDEDENTEEFTCVASDGSKIIASLSLSPAMYDGESCTQVIFRSMAEDNELEDRIKEISSQDLLTGLYNRTYFIEQLDGAVDSAAAGHQDYVLFYISLDNFARIRAEAGISNADLVLGDTAALIRGMVEETHVMARFADDVFTMLYKGSDKEAAGGLAEQIRKSVEGHMSEVSGKTYQLTVSIGLALITENSPTGEDVISRAHRASAGIEGGNGVNFYQTEQVKVGDDGKSLTSEKIKQLVREAIANNSFQLMYQPIISLHGDDDEQFEVLLRLADGDGNELNPGQFLPPAEDAGLLEKVDRWVILQSIKTLSAHRAKGSKARLFINITHRSMADSTFLPWVSVALKAARLPSDAIIFQMHENDATTYIKHATKFCQGLAQLHCKTSLNHFGCSLNPFNLLKHLTPDYVKLDGSFAQQIEESKEKQQELIDMVKSLQSKGVLTAISGVENPAVLSTLFVAGVNFIQGYYISPPLDGLDYDFASEDI